MADAKAKTINLLLYEGDLEGVISIEDSSWNSGELYSAPRDSVSELLETNAGIRRPDLYCAVLQRNGGGDALRVPHRIRWGAV